MREITHLIDQMDDADRRAYLLESLFLNTVKLRERQARSVYEEDFQVAASGVARGPIDRPGVRTRALPTPVVVALPASGTEPLWVSIVPMVDCGCSLSRAGVGNRDEAGVHAGAAIAFLDVDVAVARVDCRDELVKGRRSSDPSRNQSADDRIHDRTCVAVLRRTGQCGEHRRDEQSADRPPHDASVYASQSDLDEWRESHEWAADAAAPVGRCPNCGCPISLRRVWRREPCGVDRDVWPDLIQCDGVLAVRPGDDGLERHLDAGNVAVVGVVHLRRHGADRRSVPPQGPHEQTRTRRNKSSTGSGARRFCPGAPSQGDRRSWRGPDLPSTEGVLDVCRERRQRLEPGAFQIAPRSVSINGSGRQPSATHALRPSYVLTFSIRRTDDLGPLIRSFRCDLNRNVAAAGVEAAIGAARDKAREAREPAAPRQAPGCTSRRPGRA